MPIYEYRCGRCGRRSSVLVRSLTSAVTPICPSCGSNDLRKLVSRFSVTKSEDARLDALADPTKLSGVDEEDPRSVARWARRMGKEVGDDLGPEFEEMVDRMEAGDLSDDDMGEGGPDEGSDFE